MDTIGPAIHGELKGMRETVEKVVTGRPGTIPIARLPLSLEQHAATAEVLEMEEQLRGLSTGSEG